MSRQINFDAPLTEEDKEYLLTRSGGEELIAMNKRQFGDLSKAEGKRLRDKAAQNQRSADRREEESGEDEYHPDDIKKVQGLSSAQIKAALKKFGLSPEVTDEDRADLADDSEEAVTDKDVLVIRLLNYLDEVRKSK